MILEFLEHIFSFYSADSDTDATVMCSGVVWSCPLVSRGTDVDLLSEFVIFMIAPSPKIGGTNTFNLRGTWYLISWFWYQRLPLSPPSCLRLIPTAAFNSSCGERRAKEKQHYKALLAILWKKNDTRGKILFLIITLA